MVLHSQVEGGNMSYYDEEDFYESSEFDEKMNELKNYLRDSVKQEVQDQIASLQRENKNLKNENSHLRSKNKSIECENKGLLSATKVLKILTDKINEENVYKIIKAIFPKTFEEKGYDCHEFWSTYVNYYDNRKDVITLLKYANVNIPSELEDIILPHEWSEELLDKFFDTMHRHVNCNGCTYEGNLKYWNYRMAVSPFSGTSSYDEIPWQFVLRNPLLNSEKYALKIANAINDGYNGLNFGKICSYQDLDEKVLKLIVDNLIVKEKSDKRVFDFLIDHIELVLDKERLDIIYPEIESRWRCYSEVLRMPREYQIQYAMSISRMEDRIEFLNKTNLSKEEKSHILGSIFD